MAVMIGLLSVAVLENTFYLNTGLTAYLYYYLLGVILLMNSPWLRMFDPVGREANYSILSYKPT